MDTPFRTAMFRIEVLANPGQSGDRDNLNGSGALPLALYQGKSWAALQ
jgi:hypothetical protein